MSSSTKRSPPAIKHVLETCIYVKSMDESVEFYTKVLGLEPAIRSSRITSFPIGSTLLLLFQLGATAKDSYPDQQDHPSGRSKGCIPGHGPSRAILDQLLSGSGEDGSKGGSNDSSESALLKQHYCLAVDRKEDIDQWEEHFKAMGTKIVGEMAWERGGRSVYFTDPDGHIGEIASKGIWPNY